MQKNNQMMYSLKEHREKIITDIQDFLKHKRTNTIDFGNRLMTDFKVSGFSGTAEDESLLVQFEGYEEKPHANHIWVNKKELEKFLNGDKKIGVNLLIDNFFVENNCLVFEINLIKNGIKSPTLNAAEKFRGININNQGKVYKSYDVQVTEEKDSINKVIRVFVLEPSSSESYIEKHTVIQNKVEIKNGITFEDFHNQDKFVRKFDALEAIRMERRSIAEEMTAWFRLNMLDKVDDNIAAAFYKKIKEII